MAVNTDGKREVVGLHIGPSEAETFWSTFLKGLLRRSLHGIKLVISDAVDGGQNPRLDGADRPLRLSSEIVAVALLE